MEKAVLSALSEVAPATRVGCQPLPVGPFLPFFLYFLILFLVSRITEELSRLDGREIEEEEHLLELEARIRESLARLNRIKKQRRHLHEKGVKMVNEGAEEDIRETAAEAAAAEAAATEAAAQSPGPSGPSPSSVDWGSLNVDDVDWSALITSGVAEKESGPSGS